MAYQADTEFGVAKGETKRRLTLMEALQTKFKLYVNATNTVSNAWILLWQNSLSRPSILTASFKTLSWVLGRRFPISESLDKRFLGILFPVVSLRMHHLSIILCIRFCSWLFYQTRLYSLKAGCFEEVSFCCVCVPFLWWFFL